MSDEPDLASTDADFAVSDSVSRGLRAASTPGTGEAAPASDAKSAGESDTESPDQEKANPAVPNDGAEAGPDDLGDLSDDSPDMELLKRFLSTC